MNKPLYYETEAVKRFCDKLQLSEDTKSKAALIIEQATDAGITKGFGPLGIVSAAIYIAAILNLDHRTQRVISLICGTSEVTLRYRYREMAETLFEQWVGLGWINATEWESRRYGGRKACGG